MKTRLPVICCWVLLFLMTVMSSVCLAQSSAADSQPSEASQINRPDDDQVAPGELRLNRDYWRRCAEDGKTVLTAPSRWEKPAWNRAYLVGGIAIGIYVLDDEIQDWTQRNQSGSGERIAKFAETFGNGLYVVPSLGAIYLYGHSREDERLQRTALLGLESFLLSGAFTQAVKFAGHRHRPDSGDSSTAWDGPGLSTSNLSFPSGHAASAFAVMTVVASEYKHKRAVPLLAYSAATLTALARVYHNDHWASDAFVGSAIGYFTAKAVIALHHGSGEDKFTLLPVANDRYSALAVAYGF